MTSAREAILQNRAGNRYPFDRLARVSRRFYRGDYEGFLEELARTPIF